MGFNPGNFFSALAGLVVGVMLVSALPALGTVGDDLVVGAFNDSGGYVTRLKGKGDPTLRLINWNSRAALELRVSAGTPPMKVNSTGLVTNLNDDYLDGWNARGLRTTWGWRSNDNIANNVEWMTSRSATVPAGGGVILMSGSVDFYNSGGSADYIECFFSVNGVQIGESRNTVAVQAGQEATCHSDAASERSSGTYNVQFKTYGLADSHLWAEDGLWYFTALPN